jgi:hypothetical protein
LFENVRRNFENFCVRVVNRHTKYHFIRTELAGSSCKKYLLLSLCDANIEHYFEFLDHVQLDYIRNRQSLTDARQSALTSLSLADFVLDAYLYEKFQHAASDLAKATELLVKMLGPESSFTSSSTKLQDLTVELNSVSAELNVVTSRFVSSLEKHLQYFELSRNVGEAKKSMLLTLLASIFLPLSLGCGILSMQTRFVDLHFLLYDFFGVVFLLGSLIFAITLLLIKGLALEDKLSLWKSKHYRNRKSAHVIHVVATTLFVTFWILATASFLVGMIKNITQGLKILGFGSAALLSLLVIGTLLLRLVMSDSRTEATLGIGESYPIAKPSSRVILTSLDPSS